MADHEYPMHQARSAAIAALWGPEDEDERDEWNVFDDILSVEHRYATDIVVAIGGPTRRFRIHHDAEGGVYRVEYLDSWATPPVSDLTESEQSQVLDAIGWHDFELWKAQT